MLLSGDTSLRETFAARVAAEAVRFVGLVPLPGNDQASLRQILVSLVQAAGTPEDSSRLDRFLPPGAPGQSLAARADLNAAIRSVWSLRAFEEKYGIQEGGH